MFKSQIVVNEHTDVAAELANVEALAKRHHLDDAKLFVLMQNVEAVLSELKKQDSETAAYGIKMAIEKTVATDDYQISMKLGPRKDAPTKGGGLLNRLFGG
jgi:hypothetical protein